MCFCLWFTYLLTYLFTYLLTYLLTYSIKQSPSSEANRFPASQEIPHFMELEDPLRHSQVPATCPYPDLSPVTTRQKCCITYTEVSFLSFQQISTFWTGAAGLQSFIDWLAEPPNLGSLQSKTSPPLLLAQLHFLTEFLIADKQQTMESCGYADSTIRIKLKYYVEYFQLISCPCFPFPH